MTSQPPNLETEAASWLVQLDAGTADEEAFSAWRNADPRHAVAFAMAQASWERMGEIPSTAEPEELEEPLHSEQGVSRRQWLRFAAATVPVLAVGGAALTMLSESPAHAKTQVGERRRFAAMPGVMVELNTDSEIRWIKTENSCEIWLERVLGLGAADYARLAAEDVFT